jgi:hypothetical protein
MEHLEIPLPEDVPPANRAVKLPPFWTANQRGRGIPAAKHRQRGVQVLKLPARRPSGGRSAPGQTRASTPPVGCALADRHPEGRAALHPAASRRPEAVEAPCRDATPLSQGPGRATPSSTACSSKVPWHQIRSA